MVLETTAFDSAEYLTSEVAIAAYLSEALESGDVAFVAHALTVTARARAINQVRTGDASPVVESSAPSESDPRLSTVMRAADALGLRLTLAAASIQN